MKFEKSTLKFQQINELISQKIIPWNELWILFEHDSTHLFVKKQSTLHVEFLICCYISWDGSSIDYSYCSKKYYITSSGVWLIFVATTLAVHILLHHTIKRLSCYVRRRLASNDNTCIWALTSYICYQFWGLRH